MLELIYNPNLSPEEEYIDDTLSSLFTAIQEFKAQNEEHEHIYNLIEYLELLNSLPDTYINMDIFLHIFDEYPYGIDIKTSERILNQYILRLVYIRTIDSNQHEETGEE